MKKHVRFQGRLLMVGFGCVGQGVLPLLLRHLDMDRGQLRILTATDHGREVARTHGVEFEACPLTRENYRQLLAGRLGAGDFLLNLSYDVSSLALIEWCQAHGVLYLDACIEPWPGAHQDATAPPSARSNYAYREAALALRRARPRGPTAVVNHGVNPGLVSHFVKRALRHLARDLDGGGPPDPGAAPYDTAAPPHEAAATRHAWARLARRLGVRVIHVAERDTQTSRVAKRPGEFVNTWSVNAFVGEGSQPAELGWGTHERHFPADGGRHESGSGAAIYLTRPGAATRVRSWAPVAGPFHGFVITHGEAISIADYLSVDEGGRTVYRPTVHYAYHPCDDAVLSIHELAGANWRQQQRGRLLMNEIAHGTDELGVLLMGHARGAYWYGSRLDVARARQLAPHNNATSLQTAAGVLGGVVWALRHPGAGVVEPDELDAEAVLEVAEPYLGEMVGVYSDWTPLTDRERLFAEDLDREDPWQFKNFRVM